MENAQAAAALRQLAKEVLVGAPSLVPGQLPGPSSASASMFPRIPGPPLTPSGVQDGLPPGDRLHRPSGRPSSAPRPREATEAMDRATWRAPVQEVQEVTQPLYRVERSDPVRDGPRSLHPNAAAEAEPLEALSMPAGLQGIAPRPSTSRRPRRPPRASTSRCSRASSGATSD